MDRLVTFFLCIVAFFAVTSLLLTGFSYAQTVAKPSVPQFTLNYTQQSFDVAPTYSINPYTGQSEMTKPGGSFTAKTVEVAINNQAFVPQHTADGNYTELCYYIRSKGTYEQWITDTIYEGGNILYYNNSMQIPASSSNSTVLTFPLDRWDWRLKQGGGQIDFQVKAVIANFYLVRSYDYYIPDWVNSEVIAEGDWSSTQTLTIPNPSTPIPNASNSVPNPSSSTMPSPTVPEFPTAAVLALLAAIPLALQLIHRKNHQKFVNKA